MVDQGHLGAREAGDLAAEPPAAAAVERDVELGRAPAEVDAAVVDRVGDREVDAADQG
jgi:hypothetical protein